MRPFGLLLLATPFLAASASAQTVLLRYHPPVGKTASYTLRTSMTMETAQKTPGMMGPMHFGQSMPMTLRVLARTGDATTVETKSGPAKMDAGSPMANNPALNKVSVSRVTIDAYGTPKGASGGGPGAAMLSAMGQGSQGVAFPKGPVKVGDTWNSSLDLGKIMGAAMKGATASGRIPVVYRLAKFSGGVATIAMTAKGTVSMSVAGRPMKITMDMRSTSLIDVATGLPKSSSTTSDTNTQMPGLGTMRQRLTMTMG